MKNIKLFTWFLLAGISYANSFSISGGIINLNEEYFASNVGWGIDITYNKYVNPNLSFRYQMSFSRVTSKRILSPIGWVEHPSDVKTYNTQANIPSISINLLHQPFAHCQFTRILSPYFWFGVSAQNKMYSSDYNPPTVFPQGDTFDESEYNNFPHKDWVVHVYPSVGIGMKVLMFSKRAIIVEYQLDYSRSILPVPSKKPSITGLRVGWATEI